jgi:hypothetical protein
MQFSLSLSLSLSCSLSLPISLSHTHTHTHTHTLCFEKNFFYVSLNHRRSTLWRCKCLYFMFFETVQRISLFRKGKQHFSDYYSKHSEELPNNWNLKSPFTFQFERTAQGRCTRYGKNIEAKNWNFFVRCN